MKKLGFTKLIEKVYSGKTVFIPELIVSSDQLNAICGTRRKEEIVQEVTLFPVFREDRTIWWVVTIWKDITERKLAEDRIKTSLREKEVLLQEVHHRVKNNLQIISSLLRLQAQQIGDSSASELFRESQNRIQSMALIHERLYQSQNFAQVDMEEYIKSLVSGLCRVYGFNLDQISQVYKIEETPMELYFAIPCGLIINELVSNSLKHGFSPEKKSRGTITVCLQRLRKNYLQLTVGDDGVGFPKGIDYRKTESLGLHLVSLLAEDQLHGKIQLDREKQGTTFIIRFPKIQKISKGQDG
jgi:two-component sensor histidine kinase